MRNVRKLTALALATIGLLALTSAPAWAKEGLGVVEHIGGPGTGAGQFSFVPSGRAAQVTQPGSGVAVNSAGDVYVADTDNNRVEWFVFNAGTKVYEYAGQFNGSGKLANEGGKKAPEPLSKPEGIAIDNSSTSPSKGDVYVVDTRQGVVDKFSATGEFIFQLKVGSVSSVAIDPSGHVWVREPSESEGVGPNTVQEFSDVAENMPMGAGVVFPAPSGSQIAVDEEENLYLSQYANEVHKYNTKTAAEVGGVCGSCNARGLAIGPANNDLFVDEQTFIAQFGPFGEPFEEPVHISKPSTLGDGAGLAVGPNHEIYVADAATNEIVVFADRPGPEAPETLGAKEVKGNSAVLEGELNPHGEQGAVKYHFVYSTEGTCTGEANAGTAPVPAAALAEASKALVHVEATGLEPLAEYTYCLAAENNFTEGNVGELGPPKTFTTRAEGPVVLGESVFYGYDAEEEEYLYKFQAKLNPNHSPGETTYFFEYSTEGSVAGNTLNGTIERKTGGTFPAEAYAPEGETAESRPVRLSLTETYYYRVVASSECEPGVQCTTKGPVQAYTKSPGIEEETATTRTLNTETVGAELDPDFQASKYGVEYATSKEALEKGNGERVAAATEIPANEKTLVAHCADGSLPTFSNESFVCPDEGPAPKCEDGATPTRRGESLVCRFPVTIIISGLKENTPYYYRVFGENASTEKIHTPAHGEIKQFTTPSIPFVISTGAAADVTATSATLSGVVTPTDVNATYYFQYISNTAYQGALAKGVADPYEEGETTSPLPITASTTAQAVGPVPVTALLPGETYHYRLVAKNQFGAQFGEADEAEHTFTTLGVSPPSVSTGGASGVSQNAATLSGTVTTNGLQTNYGFEIGTAPNSYGPATGLGAIGGAATEEVHVTLGELQPGTTYYYRVEATNADGTVPGQPESFTTPGFPSLISPPASPPLIAYVAPAFPKEEKASGTTTTKKLTNKEKLAKALKTCKQDKSKSKKAKCEAAAHKKYPVASRKKGKKKKK